jgi:hypothetical protein
VRAKRVDANQSVIVEAARKLGLRIYIVSDIGRGLPDLIAQWGGYTELWEVKTENGKLTKAQKERVEEGLMMRLVRSIDDVQAAAETMKKRHALICANAANQ